MAGPIRVPEVVSTRRWGSLGLIAEAADHTTLLSNVAMNLVEKSPGAWVLEEGKFWRFFCIAALFFIP